MGSLPTGVLHVGDVYVSSRYYGYYYSAQTISDIVRVNAQGQVTQVIPVDDDPYLSVSGVELDPVNNMLYVAVTTSFNGYGGPGSGSVDGELLEFDPSTGQQVATIPLPADNSNYLLLLPVRLQHRLRRHFLDPAAEQRQHHPPGCELQRDRAASPLADTCRKVRRSAPTATSTSSTTIGHGLYQLNPTSGAVNYFAFTASPFGTLTSTAPAGSGIWAADYYDGALRFDYSGNFQQQVGFYGTNQAQTDQNGNVWTANTAY